MPNVDKGAEVVTMFPGWRKYDAKRDRFVGYSYPPNTGGQAAAVEAYKRRYGREPEQIEYALGLWRCWPAEVEP